MHRSGTSSVAAALVRLGGTAPRHLIPPASDNVRGFWESTNVIALNDEILTAGGSGWKDWRRFDNERIDAALAKTLRERAKTTLIAEFGCAGFPVIKDPRMCRLMRFWAPVFHDLGWSIRVVLPVRSPLEVAWSLRRRDGLGVAAGCLLWLRHVLDAEAETRGMRRVVIEWSGFLQDWPASLGPVAERLSLNWRRGDGLDFAEVEDFLSPTLRRFTASASEFETDPAVAALVRDAYAAMLDVANDADCPATLRRLDALRLRFEDAIAIFEPAMGEAEQVAQTQGHAVRALEGQVCALESDLAARTAEAARHAREQEEALARANAVIARFARATPQRDEGRLRLPSLRRVDRSEVRIIRNSPFFEEAFYFNVNPDVRAARCDAALHFLLHGWREGRDPGPYFSTIGYLARNPDVAAAGLNPLIHYESCGRNEGRPAIR
jgi:hypothetical protein